MRSVANDVLRDCETAAEGVVPQPTVGADFEDFWEDACRLSAAYQAARRHGLVFQQHLSSSWTSEERSDRLGPVLTSEEGRHAADEFIGHPVFHANAGRPLTLATIPDEDEDTDIAHPTVSAAMSELARAGYSQAVLKNVESKSGIWRVPVSLSDDVNENTVFDVLDWTAVRLAGRPGSLLVQAFVPMEYEYRFFVVDGRVLSGAGCVEEFTPLHRLSDSAFDTRMRRTRGQLGTAKSEDIEDMPDLFATYLRFVTQCALKFGRTAAIDVAWSPTSAAPIIVEMNSLPNAGLYASDPWVVANELIHARDRGYTYAEIGARRAR